MIPATLMISLIFPNVILNRLAPHSRCIRGFSLAAALWLSASPMVFADPILDKANHFLKTGRADAASAIYAQYLRLHPTSLPAELALAEIAMRQFNYPKARGILEQALAQHPDSGVTAASMGRLFQVSANSPAGKVADNSHNYLALAQEHFTQAIALAPENPLVLTYVAEWELQQNDMVSAERDLNKALKMNPTFVPAFQGLTRFYMKARDIPRGKDTILHALELDPLDQASYFLTAQLLATVNRPAEAVKYAEKSEQLDFGKSPERDYFLASQYEKLGETQKAVQYYENLTIYTPREAQVWLKLGELYDTLGRTSESIASYQKALALKPDILDSLFSQARANTRAEKIELALSQWRRLLALKPTDATTVQEAAGSIAGLHYLERFLHPDKPRSSTQKDLQLLESLMATGEQEPALLLDNAKMGLALQGTATESIHTILAGLSGNQDPAIAGEALFLLGNYPKANERLEEVDGLSAEEYTRLADRLLLDQELVFSKVFYQRAYQLSPDPSLEAAMKRIQAKQNLASQRVSEGNTLFNDKKYQEALEKYREAASIYRQWDSAYLRIADACERLKQWKEAKKAYDTAIGLTPGLMDSEGFAKNYRKVCKKAGSK